MGKTVLTTVNGRVTTSKLCSITEDIAHLREEDSPTASYCKYHTKRLRALGNVKAVREEATNERRQRLKSAEDKSGICEACGTECDSLGLVYEFTDTPHITPPRGTTPPQPTTSTSYLDRDYEPLALLCDACCTLIEGISPDNWERIPQVLDWMRSVKKGRSDLLMRLDPATLGERKPVL